MPIAPAVLAALAVPAVLAELVAPFLLRLSAPSGGVQRRNEGSCNALSQNESSIL